MPVVLGGDTQGRVYQTGDRMNTGQHTEKSDMIDELPGSPKDHTVQAEERGYTGREASTTRRRTPPTRQGSHGPGGKTQAAPIA